MAAGELITRGNLIALGTWVCATLMTSGAEPGELVMYGLSALLPAATATTTPERARTAAASLVSSSA